MTYNFYDVANVIDEKLQKTKFKNNWSKITYNKQTSVFTIVFPLLELNKAIKKVYDTLHNELESIEKFYGIIIDIAGRSSEFNIRMNSKFRVLKGVSNLIRNVL